MQVDLSRARCFKQDKKIQVFFWGGLFTTILLFIPSYSFAFAFAFPIPTPSTKQHQQQHGRRHVALQSQDYTRTHFSVSLAFSSNNDNEEADSLSPTPNPNPTPLCDLQTLLRLTGKMQSGGSTKVSIQSGECLLNGTVETRRAKKLFPGDVVTWDKQDFSVDRIVQEKNYVYKMKKRNHEETRIAEEQE